MNKNLKIKILIYLFTNGEEPVYNNFCQLYESCLKHGDGPLVKWLRHRPFTAVTRVRIPYGSPFFWTARWEKEGMLKGATFCCNAHLYFKGKEGMLKAQRPVATHALVRPVLRRISSAGRASALQAEGRRFDPVILHHFSKRF